MKIIAFALLLAPVGLAAQTVTPSGGGITALAGDCTASGSGSVSILCPTSSTAHTTSAASAASAPATIFTGAIFTGGTGTTNFPHVLIQPSGATARTNYSTAGTAFGINTGSGFTGNLLDLGVNGASKFTVDSTGALNGTTVTGTTFTATTVASSGNNTAGAASILGWNSRANMTASAVNVMNLGGADSATPFGWTMQAQDVAAGTSNTAGVNLTLQAGTSTGSGTAGDLVLKTGGTGAGATAKNAMVTAIAIKGATQLVQLPAITTDSGKTDATICEDTTNHALYSGSGTLGICLGTSSVRFKHDIAPLAAGLPEIMRLRPVSYKLNADHGDPNKTLYGFTAEQMQPVLPKLVGLDDKGLPNSADYLGLVPVLVRAVQQQQVEIEALKKQIANDNLRMARLP